MNKILLLGSSGFIGSHLIKKINMSCENKLMVILHKNFDFFDYEDFDAIVSDFTDIDLYHFKRFKPDTIFHLGRNRGSGFIGRFLAANKGKNGNRRIIKYLLKTNLNPRVFYFSGTLIYGNKGSEIADEKSTINPTSFSREYYIAEKPWYEESIKLKANISMFRLPWVVGKGSWFYHHYIQFALKHGYVPLYSKGENWMSLIDVNDCCSLALHISRQSQIFPIINLFNPNLIVRQTELVYEKKCSVTMRLAKLWDFL